MKQEQSAAQLAPHEATAARTSHIRDWGMLVLCNLIWGSQFVIYKIVQRQVGPVFAMLLPITCAMLLLMPMVHRELARDGSTPRGRMPLRDVGEFVLVGICGQVVAQLFVAWGVRLTLASNAALLTLALPVSTALMAYLFLGERMTLMRALSFAVAVAGVLECAGISWGTLNFKDTKFLLGNLMLFLAINGAAFYNTYSKKLLRRYSPLQVLLYSYYVVVAFTIPIALYAEPQTFLHVARLDSSVWVGLLLLAFLQYFAAMVMLLSVLTRLDATQAGLSNYLIPVFGVVAAAVVLHERLTMYMILGGLLVLASTLLVTAFERKA